MKKIIATFFAFVLFVNCYAQKTVVFSKEQLIDKIKGGWAGQIIGVNYGAPTEFLSENKMVESLPTWKPSLVSGALAQDDLYVEMTFVGVMDSLGLAADTRDYGRAFTDSKYGLCHANAGTRLLLNEGLDAEKCGLPQYNLHYNDIDFQIESDFIGLMCPGMPQSSNQL